MLPHRKHTACSLGPSSDTPVIFPVGIYLASHPSIDASVAIDNRYGFVFFSHSLALWAQVHPPSVEQSIHGQIRPFSVSRIVGPRPDPARLFRRHASRAILNQAKSSQLFHLVQHTIHKVRDCLPNHMPYAMPCHAALNAGSMQKKITVITRLTSLLKRREVGKVQIRRCACVLALRGPRRRVVVVTQRQVDHLRRSFAAARC